MSCSTWPPRFACSGSAGVPPAMPVFLPAFFEERRQGCAPLHDRGEIIGSFAPARTSNKGCRPGRIATGPDFRMKPAIVGLLLLARGLVAQVAQGDQHVTWKLSVEPPAAPPGGKVLVRMAGHIDEGWHLYSMSTPAAIATKFQLAPSHAIARVRTLQPQPKHAFDANFNSGTETFDGDVAFLLELELKKDAPAGAAELAFSARYQTCNDKSCVPSKWTGAAKLTVDPAAAPATVVLPAGPPDPGAPAPDPPPPPAAPAEGLLAVPAVAFGFGLASIFTPCVFPMIPITMSYFLNRESGGRRESIVQ